MGRPGRSKKPCPGCGSTDGRPTGEVCRECRLLLEDGKKWREDLRRREEAGEEQRYRFASRLHWLEPFTEITGSFGQRDPFEKALYAFITTAFRVDEGRGAWGDPLFIPKFSLSASVQADTNIWAKPEVRDRLVELLVELRVALKATYAAGVKHGSNVLLRMAGGEITLDDMNERVERAVVAAQEARSRVAEVSMELTTDGGGR